MKASVRLGLSVIAPLILACGTLEISFEATPTPDRTASGTVAALQTQNAQLGTSVAVLQQPQPTSTPLVVKATPSPLPGAAPAAMRINFVNGATVGVVSAPIPAHQSQVYVLDAFQYQPMFAYVASPQQDVILSIQSDRGATLLSPDAHQTSWQGTLPQNGNYFLTVHGGSATENFSLTVTIPLRLMFKVGATSATVSGQTVAGYDVSYAVNAAKGQKMSLNLENLSSKASLSVYGFADGQRYLRSEDGQRTFELVLPATQDYIIVVVPMDGTVVSYTLTVSVK